MSVYLWYGFFVMHQLKSKITHGLDERLTGAQADMFFMVLNTDYVSYPPCFQLNKLQLIQVDPMDGMTQ
jgi:hypothetical protein